MVTLGAKIGKCNWPEFERLVRLLKEYGFKFQNPKSKEWTRLADDVYAPRIINQLKQLGIRVYIKDSEGTTVRTLT